MANITARNAKTNASVTSVDTEKMKKLEEENASMRELLAKLSARLDEMETKEQEAAPTPSINREVTVATDYPEPDANKQIKIMSMFYGSLNICNNQNRSVGRTLSFSRFGEIKSVLYHDLVDYVNTERRFAEEGYFYILDKAAVYHLGLTNEYTHLVDGDIVNHMMEYSNSDLDSIVSTMTDAQKDSIANLFADKIYHGKDVDLNKIAIISKHLPVSIEQMVQDMHDFDERAKATKAAKNQD